MALGFGDFTLVRWARTALGVDNTNPLDIQEPPGGSKDTGFTSGGASDNLWRQWFNWFFQQLGKTLEYFRDLNDARADPAQVALVGLAGDAGAITGLAGSSTISAVRVLVAGRHYDAPATVVSVPVQNTLPTMHRIIVARVLADQVSIVRLDGTVDATDPPIATNEVQLHRLIQLSGVATYTSEDLRNFGVVQADVASFRRSLVVGSTETGLGEVLLGDLEGYNNGQYMLRIDSAGGVLGNDRRIEIVREFGETYPAFSWEESRGLRVDPNQWAFQETEYETRRWMGASGVALAVGSPTIDGLFADMTAGDELRFDDPRGGSPYGCRAYVQWTSSGSQATLKLYAKQTNGTITLVDSVTFSGNSGVSTLTLGGNASGSSSGILFGIECVAGTIEVRRFEGQTTTNPFPRRGGPTFVTGQT